MATIIAVMTPSEAKLDDHADWRPEIDQIIASNGRETISALARNGEIRSSGMKISATISQVVKSKGPSICSRGWKRPANYADSHAAPATTYPASASDPVRVSSADNIPAAMAQHGPSGRNAIRRSSWPGDELFRRQAIAQERSSRSASAASSTPTNHLRPRGVAFPLPGYRQMIQGRDIAHPARRQLLHGRRGSVVVRREIFSPGR